MDTTSNNTQPIMNPEQVASDAGKQFLSPLEDPKNWTEIPLLNYTPLENLKEHSMVRFRGMIQDMQDPEIYLERYEVQRSDGTKRLQEGKYRECLNLDASESVNMHSESNVNGERRTLFLVSIPGINDWTKDYEERCNQRNIPEILVGPRNNTCGQKRCASSDDQEEAMEECAEVNTIGSPNATASSYKRQRREDALNEENASKSNTLSPEYLLNSPIPERPSKACMVTIYNDFDSYKLNSVVDVVGFLAMNPFSDASNIDTEMLDGTDNAAEYLAQNPPPSLIPRLHAIAVHHLPHGNPLLDARLCLQSPQFSSTDDDDFDMFLVRKELHLMLKLCLFNDDLAADYLLSHLISNVFTRSEMQTIGKFALNICNLPKSDLSDYTKKLYEILELLLPASHYLPMSLETLNEAAFAPRKDYETNKLVSGMLQLAPHTHLVLDETCMQEGKLENHGVHNIKELANVIRQQQIQCDFRFYNIDYDVDIPVLVLSEGRSMLPQDYLLPLQTDAETVAIIMETLKAALHYLNPTRLDQFRRFLTKAKTFAFELQPDESLMIQNDFVVMRAENPKMQADELHALIVLGRLLSVAHGKKSLGKEEWELARQMEMQRKQRVKALPASKNIGHPAF